MRENMVNRICTFALVFAMIVGLAQPMCVARAADTAGATGTAATVIPFKNQWMYYGQTRTFIEDEHYSVHGQVDPSYEGSWYLDIDTRAGIKVGQVPYVLKSREDGSVLTGAMQQAIVLASDAPAFEVKEYKTDEKANVPALVNTQEVSVEAPEGFLVSATGGIDPAPWDAAIEVPLGNEGANEISYYLRSNADDGTRKAIDTTRKTATVVRDTISPTILSLECSANADVAADAVISGSESAKYYYAVRPVLDDGAETAPADITSDMILEWVTTNVGIVGYGRVDGSVPTALSFKGLTPEKEYKVYAFLEDDAGNRSAVGSTQPFVMDKETLTGTVEVSGTAAVDQTLTAKAVLASADPGQVQYQWYRVKLAEDAESLEEVVDETGGAEKDDLEAEADDEDDEDDGDDEDDDDEDDDDGDSASAMKMAVSGGDGDSIVTIDNADPIPNATSDTYKITKADIGYRLIAYVSAGNYSGYVAGSTTTFVPKLMPTYTLPKIASAKYSPKKKLSAIKLPAQWSWVDSTIVPVYGNSGYRARFVPRESKVYKTVIVRVKVPRTKKTLRSSMIKVSRKKAYTGTAIKNNFSVKDGKKVLTAKRDYRVTYKNNKKLGKAVVKFRGIGNYKGTASASYQIVEKSVKDLAYKYSKRKIYTGKERTADIVVRNGKVRLQKGKDFTVEYSNNEGIGKATAVIRGKGNYKGEKTLHFSIVPGIVSIKKVTKNGRTFRLRLEERDEVKGYYVYVSTSRYFTRNKTQGYVATGAKFGVRRLAKGTYYVRVKAYSRAKGKSYVSAYSKVKKIRIK